MANLIMAATFIEQMARYEDKVSEFYRLCALMLPQDKDFWNTLAEQESWHAKALRTLKESVRTGELKLLEDKFNLREIEFRPSI